MLVGKVLLKHIIKGEMCFLGSLYIVLLVLFSLLLRVLTALTLQTTSLSFSTFVSTSLTLKVEC